MAEAEASKGGRILIVDADPSVLSSLRRLLRHEQWELLLTTTAEEGLERLAEHDIDLVVSDIRLGGMDGATFLKKVKENYPHTVRVILTGHARRRSVTEAFTEAGVYQLVPKPWDDEELKDVLRRGMARAERQSEEAESLTGLLSEIDVLPSLPDVYLELKGALEESEEGSTDRVAEVIARDPAIAARTLRIANSAFFGQRRQVDTVQRAIGLIGLAMIESIVLGASVFQDLACEDTPGFAHAEFWRHSLACGLIARFVEERHSRDRKRSEMALLAGTLHDLGKLVLAKFYHDRYLAAVTAAQRDREFISVKESELFGLPHTTLGGHLADWWNMPVPIVSAIRYHDDPSESSVDRPLVAVVHLADVLVNRAKIGHSGNGRIPAFHASLSDILGLDADGLRETEEAAQKMVGDAALPL